MAKEAPDIIIGFTFNFEKPEATIIYTNARTEALEELLTNWVQDQVGSGGGGDPPTEKDETTITIGYFLSDDCFGTESDAGNKGLTVGVVIDMIPRLSQLIVKPWSERPQKETTNG